MNTYIHTTMYEIMKTDLPQSTQNSTQHSVIPTGRESEGEHRDR